MKLDYLAISIVLLLSFQCYGQKSKAELIFKDGVILKGYGEPTNVNNIRFRKEKRAKKQFFSFEEVDTLKVYYDFNPTIFVLVKIKDKTIPQVLEMAHTGKNVTYFREVSQGYNAPMMTPAGGGGFMMTGGGMYRTTYSYLRKPGEEYALYLGSSNWLTKNFKKTASEFFSDCPHLVSKISNRELKKRDLKEIIHYYNSVCE